MDSITELTENYLATPSSKVPGGLLRQSIAARKLSLTKPSGENEIAGVGNSNQKLHKMILRDRRARKFRDETASTKSKDFVYVCPECERKFTDSKKLNNHRRVGHKVQEMLSTTPTPMPVQPDNEELPLVGEQDVHAPSSPLPGPSTAGNPVPESVHRLLRDCEKYAALKEVGELGSLTTTPPPSLDSSETPSPSTRSNHSVSSLFLQPPVTPASNRRRVHFQTPRRTISEDKAARGVGSILPPPTPRGISTVCPICDLILPNMGSYKNHLEIHEGKRPFMCPECYRGYETEIQLLEHFSRHSKESTFVCGGCSKKYKTSRGLHNHQLLKTCSTPVPGR